MTPEELLMLGASDAAAIVGLSPWKKPVDVWRRCMGENVDPPNPKVLRRGNLAEPIIRQIATEDLGLHLLGPRKIVDKARPWLRMSLDDVHLGSFEEVVEFKSVGLHGAHHWEEDSYPAWYEPQAQIYMHGLKSSRARLIALIGWDDLQQRIIPVDGELQGMLLDAMERFWTDYVLTKKPPPPDSSEAYGDFLAHMKRQPKSIPATPEMEHLAAQLRQVKAIIKEAEGLEKELRNKLLFSIGDAEAVDGLLSFKMTKGRPVTDWAGLCQSVGVSQEAIEQFTKRVPFPSLRLQAKKDDANE